VKPLHYKAFISYSHQDESWAAWLQKALESYRVPKRLVGTGGRFGPIPGRLVPIFRDREDLSSASDLSSKIKDELTASETLIVVCSPAAAGSNWVNEEIRFFRELGREDRVFALIVDGDPGPGAHGAQCFPEALLQPGGSEYHAPLAADARKYGDGKSLAKLKLVAGILGIRLDELRRRDAQRRRRNLLLSSTAAIAVVALTATLAYTTISSQKTALQQRSNTEELLSYMLGNLKSLDPIVGLEVVDQNDEKVMYYLNNLGFGQMDNEELIEAAMAWREEGQALHRRGELEAATEPFEKSRAAFIELHQRENGSRRSLFELGQAEFYVGYVHLDKGELDEAQASFTRYGAITRRLMNADPNNAEMVMELAWTLVNLSVVERARQNPDSDTALSLAQSAMQYNQIALVLDPASELYRQELAVTAAFVADAWLDVCGLDKAFEFRQLNVDMSRQMAQEEPDDADLRYKLGTALSGLASVMRRMALSDQAIEKLQESEILFRQLSEQDPENRFLRWMEMLRQQRILWLRALSGDVTGAFADASRLMPDFKREFEDGMYADFGAAVEFSQYWISYADMAYQAGQPELAESELGQALEHLTIMVRQQPQNRESRYQLARASFEQWMQTGVMPSDEIVGLLEGYLQEADSVKGCDDASLAARLAVMNGNMEQARSYNAYLLGRGYFEPEYVRFCTRYRLCPVE